MRFHEIVISETERNRSFKVFQFLAESISQPSETAAMHTERVILLFNVRRGNAIHIRHARNNRLFDADNLRRAVAHIRWSII